MNDARFDYGMSALRMGAQTEGKMSASPDAEIRKKKTVSAKKNNELTEESISALPVENMDEEAAYNRKNKIKSLIKLAVITVSLVIIIIVGSIAWFTMNREVENNGLAMTATDAPFELKSLGSASLYDDFLDSVASGYSSSTVTGNSSGIKWKLVNNTSELNNFYDGEGNPDLREITRRDSSVYGLKPGDSGTLKYTVVPKEDALTIDFDLRFTGYSATYATTNNVEYKTNDPLTAVDDNTVNNFLSSHILFFYKGTDNKKHLITDDGFNKSFTEETEVTLYWVWPATLKEILEADIDNLDDEDASKEIRMLFFEHPEYFLKPPGSESFDEFRVSAMSDKTAQEASILTKLSIVNGRDYNTYGAMYNDADQAIGDNINFLLVELFAEKHTE